MASRRRRPRRRKQRRVRAVVTLERRTLLAACDELDLLADALACLPALARLAHAHDVGPRREPAVKGELREPDLLGVTGGLVDAVRRRLLDLRQDLAPRK